MQSLWEPLCPICTLSGSISCPSGPLAGRFHVWILWIRFAAEHRDGICPPLALALSQTFAEVQQSAQVQGALFWTWARPGQAIQSCLAGSWLAPLFPHGTGLCSSCFRPRDRGEAQRTQLCGFLPPPGQAWVTQQADSARAGEQRE